MRAEKKIEELMENLDLVKYIDDEKAMEFGHKQDIEIAYEEGHSFGKRSALIETAKKMLEEKIDISTISKITNLSKKEIEKLK